MNTLIVLVGLPRSGKTTWANGERSPMVSPDAIRLALHGRKFVPEAEPIVWVYSKLMVRSLFYAGHNRVIVDGCHVKRKYREEWYASELFGPNWKTVFQEFSADKATCIRRAEKRDPDLIPVIEKMAAEWEPLQPDEELLVRE